MVLATGLASSSRAWVRPTRLRLERWARGWPALVFDLHISFSTLFSYWVRARVLGVFFAALGTGGWRVEDEGNWGRSR